MEREGENERKTGKQPKLTPPPKKTKNKRRNAVKDKEKGGSRKRMKRRGRK